MRILLKILLVVGALWAVVVLGSLEWLGVFDRVAIGERVAGPYTIVYRETSRADAREVGQISTDLHRALAGVGITRAEPFDAFRPDGHNDIGFRVAVQDTALLAQLEPSWKHRTIEAAPSMTARLPWRSSLSVIVGYLRINPALKDWRSRHGYAKAVAYVIHEGATSLYVQPIVK